MTDGGVPVLIHAYFGMNVIAATEITEILIEVGRSLMLALTDVAGSC